jgi:hypothetical protein
MKKVTSAVESEFSTKKWISAARWTSAAFLVAPLVMATGCEASESPPAVVVSSEALIVAGTPGGEIVASLHVPQAEHCDQGEINAIADPHARFEEAFECGDELFETKFNALDGVGAKVGDGQRFTRVPRADTRGPGEWARHTPERATGPNAEATRLAQQFAAHC